MDDEDELSDEDKERLSKPHEREFRCRGCNKVEKGQSFRLEKRDELDDEAQQWFMSPPPGWFAFMWPRAMNVIWGFVCSRECAGN